MNNVCKCERYCHMQYKKVIHNPYLLDCPYFAFLHLKSEDKQRMQQIQWTTISTPNVSYPYYDPWR